MSSDISWKIDEYIREIRELLEREEYITLSFLVESLPIPILHEVLIRLSDEERIKLFANLSIQPIAEVLTRISEDILYEIVTVKGIDEFSKAILKLPFNEIADIISKLPPRMRNRAIELLPTNIRSEVLKLLKYPPESVGGVMTIQVPVFNCNIKVGDAISMYITKDKLGLYDRHHNIYVVDDEHKLIGCIEVRLFLTKPKDLLLKQIVRKPCAVIEVHKDREEAVKLAIDYDLIEVPVVDSEGRFLGIVTLDDILDIMSSEFSEDLLKHGGIIETIKGSYITADPFKLALKRSPMIILLYIMNAITGSIVASFENVIARAAILAAFLPMLADNSGNIASQSSSLTLKSMILGEIRVSLSDFMKVLLKEMSVSTLMNFILAPFSFLISFVITMIAMGDINLAIRIAIVVLIALVISSYIADIVGSLLPMILAKIKLDPAIVSSPLVTTIADIVTASSYFSIALILLGLY
jgi:magnesium transporter